MYFDVNDLAVSRGPIRVLKGISVHVSEGEIASVIGANGAGKTTTLLAIVGLLKVDSGSITLSGEDITGFDPNAVLRRGISLCPAERHVFPRMTVMENLRVGAFIRRDTGAIQEDLGKTFGYFPRLRERVDQLAGTLSGGEQQMLAMARSIMSRPRLLLLDEPSLGLAPILVRELGRLIKDINGDGTTTLLVEQNAMLALELSKRTYVMELGKIVMEGDSAELSKDEKVRKAFLGEA